eukprot:scaffold19136_cov23-Tisochrysis_lutea.AAC.1
MDEPPLENAAIESGERTHSVLTDGVGHVRKALGTARFDVHRYHDLVDAAVIAEELPKLRLGRLVWQVAHEEAPLVEPTHQLPGRCAGR